MMTRSFQCAALALALVSGQANAAATIYGSYYDETASGICNNASTCRVNFSQLPSDKLVRVNRISCETFTSKTVTKLTFRISATLDGASVSGRSLPMTVPAAQLGTSGELFTNSREDTNYLVGQGRFPVVLVTTADVTTFSITCTIIGDLVTPIQ